MGCLAEKLKALRGNLSYYEVSRGSGVASIDLARYEAATYRPSMANLKKLAQYYEVPYRELRTLYYHDLFGTNPEELAILRCWATRHYMTENEKHLIELLRSMPHRMREKLMPRIVALVEGT